MENSKQTDMIGINRLQYIMECLRDPKSGCPWDIEQTWESIAPYTIEEAYEVLDAIDKKDKNSLKEELGDLLLQVIFHSQIASESGDFSFESVVESICDKMVRRHPHVFGNENAEDVGKQMEAWENLKEKERLSNKACNGVLDGIAKSLPALLRALKLQKRAARVGFDWPNWMGAYKKFNEEINELSVELNRPNIDKDKLIDEFGDVMFSAVNVARKIGIDPEGALRIGNAKFEARFSFIEATLAKKNRAFDTVTLEEMENLWNEAKLLENSRTKK